ncbi:Hypothetical predicted protein [Paramuricea clavata]|uniref:Uncharacterized protein n=1 Tax=Paramuricea clavata TaxID=317549 RepID=A0A6S7HD40_PARCT|nr:Hypothetical predicted protein [Paramuricea clavata]
MIPVKLFNFISWCFGFSDEPEMNSHVTLNEGHLKKVLSIYARTCYLSIQMGELPFHLGKKKTPNFSDIGMESEEESRYWEVHQELARRLDFAYTLMKMHQSEVDLLPGWTGFNMLLRRSNIPPQSKIRYLPIIDGSPSEYSTLYTALQQSINIADELLLERIVLIFDEAIYAKFQQIGWKNKIFMSRFIVRLRDFHTTMSFLSAIGVLFRDAGLQCVNQQRKDLDETQKAHHEKEVENVKTTLQNMVNPSEPGRTELVHFTSGLVGTENVKLKTFSSMTKKVKVSSKSGADATLKSNRNLFAHMLLLAQSREIDMKEVLSFCLGPFLLSLSMEMGLLHKMPKSKLMGLLESSTVDPCVESVPEGNACWSTHKTFDKFFQHRLMSRRP